MKTLLHVCCAVCGAGAIEELMKDSEVILFFSNSNIFPKDEFEKRLENAKKISEIYGLELVADEYDHDDWLDFIKGLESEPEKGKRCLKCFEFNLRKTAEEAKDLKIENFTTTLTISPHKDSKKIFDIGKRVAYDVGVNFLEKDFKKNDGFKKSNELSKKHNLYRQNYCGCEFSLKRSIASPNE
jgi:predicted adenine nucleotide alpha hydrolase (AANH) superfamily ATPase